MPSMMGDTHIGDENYEPDEGETIIVAAVRPQDMINEFRRDIMIGLTVFEDLFPEMPFYPILRENGILDTREEYAGLCQALSIIESCFGHYVRLQDDGRDVLQSVFDEINERVSKIGVAVEMDAEKAQHLIQTVNNMDQGDGLEGLLEQLGIDAEGDDEVHP